MTPAEPLAPEPVAVTVTVCTADMELGAVYKPVCVMLPTAGLMDQLTLTDPPPPSPPLAEAENCWVWEAESEAEPGLTLIDVGEPAGTSATVACAILLGSAMLAAVTVTFCAVVIVVGARYNPLAIDPTWGEMDQETPVFDAPVTEAVN